MDDWSNIAYLQRGTQRQQEAYQALLASDLFMVLAPYNPVLVGPLALGLESTVLRVDILCHAPDLQQMAADLELYYQRSAGFEVEFDDSKLGSHFVEQLFTIKIQAYPQPVELIAAYQIMTVASRLFRIGSDDARSGVQTLLQEGLDLYTALATYFQLPGEPEAALTALYSADYAQLEAIVVAAAHRREPYAFSYPA